MPSVSLLKNFDPGEPSRDRSLNQSLKILPGLAHPSTSSPRALPCYCCICVYIYTEGPLFYPVPVETDHTVCVRLRSWNQQAARFCPKNCVETFQLLTSVTKSIVSHMFTVVLPCNPALHQVDHKIVNNKWIGDSDFSTI